MTCGYCRYEWCWACGMDFKSSLHAGGIFCVFVGWAFARRSIFIMLILGLFITAFFPLILFFFCCVFGGIGVFYVCEAICIALLGMDLSHLFRLRSYDDYHTLYSCLPKIVRFLKMTTKFLFLTCLFLIYLSFTVALGSIIFIIVVFPSILYYFFVMFRVIRNWRKTHIL